MLSNLNIWQLLGGLGLFLFAMGQIESALSNLGSRSFKNFLIRHTDKPLKSVLSGGLTTALLQSSSLVGLLVLAFTGAGLITLENALGVIFGANLGTTLTGWIVATIGFKLDLGALSLPIIFFGSFLSILGQERQKQVGRVLTAIGLLLLGLEFMKDSVESLKDQFDINVLKQYSAWQYLLFGTVFAAVVQSSSATIIIALASLDGGVITLPAAAAIAIGADLGTTSTILIGAAQGTSSKKRVAAAHVIFNLSTDLVAFIFLIPLLAFIKLIGIHNPLYTLVAFHSLFNFIGILIFLPLIKPIAKFLEQRFETQKITVSRYINQVAPNVIDAGLIAIRKETAHFLQRTILQNFQEFDPELRLAQGFLPIDEMSAFADDKQKSFLSMYHQTKLLEGEILQFSTDLQSETLDAEQSSELSQLISAVRHAMHGSKNIKDIRPNLEEFGISNKVAVENFYQLIRELMRNFYSSILTLKSGEQDPVTLQELLDLKNRTMKWHDEIHQKIIQFIHLRQVVDAEGSSMLNVNREILNSNRALISALANYHLDLTQPDSGIAELID